jgi:HPt (histidine-containing phosphotransfer) domain-containing protein
MVDLEVLKSLEKAVGDPGFIVRLIQLFFDSMPESLAQLKKHLEAGDAKKMGLAAHAITSSAQNVGATKVGELTKQLDRLGRSGSLAGADQLVAELLSAYDQSKSILERFAQSKST